MTECYNILAESNNMLSILSGYDLELPWRYQKWCNIEVPYDEYKKFCSKIVEVNIPWLNFSVNHYKTMLSSTNESLCLKTYYYDLYTSIIKETFMAHTRGLEASIILPRFNNADKTLDFTSASDEIINIDKSAITNAIKRSYLLTPQNIDTSSLSKHNKYAYRCGLLLGASALSQHALKYNLERRFVDG